MYGIATYYLIIKLIASIQTIEIQEVKKCLHSQHHLQMINVTEVNQACLDQEIK